MPLFNLPAPHLSMSLSGLMDAADAATTIIRVAVMRLVSMLSNHLPLLVGNNSNARYIYLRARS